MAMELMSPAFRTNEAIPVLYTCDGDDISPPLKWQNVPVDTRSFVLLCEDPDAPSGIFSHWVLLNLPADLDSLPEAFPEGETQADGGIQGRNDFDKIAYGGPCPPQGPAHRYHFRLFALDDEIDLSPGAKREDVLDHMQDHVLEEATLIGTYQRV